MNPKVKELAQRIGMAKGLSDPFGLETLEKQLVKLSNVDESQFQQEAEGVKLTLQGRITAVTQERDKIRDFINDNVMSPKNIPEGSRESLKRAADTVKVLTEVNASLNTMLSSSATGKPSTTFTEKHTGKEGEVDTTGKTATVFPAKK
jgi:hypothetical protein